MHKLWKASVFALSVTACLDEGTFGKFDQAELTSFVVVEEATASLIFSDEHRVVVTLPAGGDLSSTTLKSLTVSSLASASLSPGNAFDLEDGYTLIVTAEDGKTVDWEVEGQLQAGPPGGDGDGDSGMGGMGGTGGDCPSYLVTYQTTGTFEITNTPANAGNGVHSIGPGSISLRFIPTGPGSASVTVVAYEIPQQFVVNAPGATSTTDTLAKAGPNECGLARGSLSGNVLSWSTCDYGPAPPLGTTSWSADDIVGGAGCLNNYTVKGEVTCQGIFCAEGTSGVKFPLTIDDLYPQPLNAFEFNDDFTTFSMHALGAPPTGSEMKGVEVPNKEPSRTWLGLDGTQRSSECAQLPVCEP